MMQLQLFFIRHKPTGHYLPEPAGRMGRGGSHTEPSPDLPPRIFLSQRSAKCALVQWLRGKFHRFVYQDYYGEVDESVDIVPVPSRRKADMEIVPVTVQLP